AILLTSVLINWIDTGRYDWLIYSNDQKNADCVLHGYRYFCYSPYDNRSLERKASEKCVAGTLWSFAMLKTKQITSTMLIEWLIPFYLIEQYADYLNLTDSSYMNHTLICNCTNNRIGTNCEYQFVSRNIDVLVSVNSQRARPITSYETLTLFIDEFVCNGSMPILEWRQICDGIVHCTDGQDEFNCHLLELNQCEYDEFQCRNGMCVPKEFLFDAVFDCMDLSDEQELPEPYARFDLCRTDTRLDCDERVCRKDQFSCGNGLCIPWSTLILGYNECENYRDVAYRCETIDSLASNSKKNIGICQQTTMELETLTNTSDCITSLRHMLMAELQKSSNVTRQLALNNMINTCAELIPYPSTTSILSPVLVMFYNRTRFEIFYASKQNFHQQMLRKPHVYCLSGSMVCNNMLMKLSNNRTFVHSNELVTRDRVRSYLCRNTTDSISLRRLNDGYEDCLYGDDERNNQYNQIQPYRYRCETVLSPRQYISYQQLGNGIKNCLDGSDEISMRVRWSLMKCDTDETYSCWVFQANGIDEDRISTVQLPYHRHCDTIWDTMNGQDEKNCSHWICAQNAYRCNRTGQCVHQTYFCDGVFDCDDGEDELNCTWTAKRWTFEEICNRTNEHFCITQEYLEDPISRRPCISYGKAGDGHMDCIGGRDERNVFSCSDHRMLGDRFLCDNQTKCLNYTMICDGVDHCLDRTDELICHWNRSSCPAGYFACKSGTGCILSRCDVSGYCSDKSHFFWCPISTSKNRGYREDKYQYVLNYEQSCYQQSINQQITRSVKTVSADVQTKEIFQFPLYGYCNRGFYLTISNGSKPLCFCPPSYYGNHCQYDSRRVTVRFRFDRRHRFDIPIVLSVLVSLIYNESEIIDHQFVFDVNQDNAPKYNMYLLYPRPRPRGLYSVRFEAYHTTSFVAAWQYKISPFDFLPAYRLAKILRFPVAALPVLCTVNPCQNNGSCYLMNSNQLLCFCSREWYGRLCEKPLRNVTCARHSLVRDRHICICPYGYMQPQCFVRNWICEHSSPCPTISKCYTLSQEPPNRYYCLCEGLMCNVRDALLTIQRNQSNLLPYLVQLLKITSDYPNIRQQILVHPLTNFPMHIGIEMRDPRNTKLYLPEIALLFSFEPHKRSVSIILHLLYINCSTTFRNLSVDLDHQPSRCQSLQDHGIPSIKSLRLFCQKTQHKGCFLAKDYLCWCNSSMLSYTECLSYHQRQTTCTHCYNHGYCVR
ncbi:unnamed protein product, partial [Adineta steineri]